VYTHPCVCLCVRLCVCLCTLIVTGLEHLPSPDPTDPTALVCSRCLARLLDPDPAASTPRARANQSAAPPARRPPLSPRPTPSALNDPRVSPAPPSAGSFNLAGSRPGQRPLSQSALLAHSGSGEGLVAQWLPQRRPGREGSGEGSAKASSTPRAQRRGSKKSNCRNKSLEQRAREAFLVGF
jgi:hypothetical protein